MGTISRSIGNSCSVSLTKKEVVRSKSNNKILTSSELKSIEKLGIDLTQHVYSGFTKTFRFKYNSYNYIELTDEAISLFILIINRMIESGNTIIDNNIINLIDNANLAQPDTFKIKTTKRLIDDIDLVVGGKQTIKLTNKYLDLKLIDMLDDEFILKTNKLTGFNDVTVLVKPDKSLIEFGCRSFKYHELTNAINIITEMLVVIDEKV